MKQNVLKNLRLNNKKTQSEISLLLGITRAAYTNIENGRREPDNETLLKLSSIFNVSIDFLLGKDTSKVNHPDPPKSETEKKFLVLARRTPNMSEKEHKEFIQFIENSAETFFRLKGIKVDDDNKDNDKEK
ncbi:MAG: hypothetical protein K0S55_415 [Clostridia bacterium]|jgi:transcriptional regulator with XRE-family HTH domain|nr:hypothetical protein [Clostridia bacterium]